MRSLLIIVLMQLWMPLWGQKHNRLSFVAQLQPELAFHKDNYAYRWRETHTTSTFNTGIEAAIHYDLSKRVFAEVGLGYISRRLNTVAFLNQAALPPPRQSLTKELVNTKAVAFRILQLPLNFGYNIIQKTKVNYFLSAGFTGNYLLNTYYHVTGFTQYEGAYKKNYWQGYSLNLGWGADYKISKNLSINSRLTYSIVNTVKNDEYLFKQGEYVIPLPHTYLKLSTGIKVVL